MHAIRFVLRGCDNRGDVGLRLRIGFAGQKFYSRSHDAVICVYDEGGNMIEAHEHIGDFREW
jgi:hypothetical protein